MTSSHRSEPARLLFQRGRSILRGPDAPKVTFCGRITKFTRGGMRRYLRIITVQRFGRFYLYIYECIVLHNGALLWHSPSIKRYVASGLCDRLDESSFFIAVMQGGGSDRLRWYRYFGLIGQANARFQSERDFEHFFQLILTI